VTRAQHVATLGRLGVMFILLATACRGGHDEEEWVVPVPKAAEIGQPIRIVGVVRHLDVEGGVYVIRGMDGVSYDPTNLPQAFQKDGLPVEADARRQDDMMSIHQVGPIVELERIRRR
jgi:hypothetical protein